MVTPELEADLLIHSRVHSVAPRMPAASYQMLGTAPAIDTTFDLREETAFRLIRDAFVTLIQPRNRVLRVIGPARIDPRILVEVTFDEDPLRYEMYDYPGRILLLSIVLSLITATLVYLSLHLLMVRPMRRITAQLVAFRDDPEDASKDLGPTNRADEIGVAQRELTEMQRGLRAALRQRAHLVALGSAVSKIGHDLRNMLSTAALVSERLADSDDPEVRRQAPSLVVAIDRAVTLCVETLRFARARELALKRDRVDLPALVDDVGKTLLLSADGSASRQNDIADDFAVTGDYDQLFRVFLNLGHNAFAVMETFEKSAEVPVSAARRDGRAVIEVTDNGPGLSPRAKDHLFEPFAGSTRSGGSGLGLPIAREIMHAHGGEISIARSDETGTVIRLELPDEG